MNRVLRAWAVLLAVLLSTLAAAADLVIGLSADVTSIDPHVLNAAPNNGVADQIYGTLVLNDARQRQQPGLAESWRAIDETTWEFRLRRGVKLHDGSDFTAEDVAFTIDRPATLKGVGGQFSVFSRAVREKFVVDAHTNAEKGFGNFNWARYSNAQLDKLIEQALATVDDAQREKLLREGQQLAFADQAVVPLHYQVNAWAARQGLVYTPCTDERTHAHLVRPQ